MEFFNSAVDVLKTLVVALGAGLGVWGAVNLMEGYGGDNPSAKSQGKMCIRDSGEVISLTIDEVYLFQKYLASHSITLMADDQKLPCICID